MSYIIAAVFAGMMLSAVAGNAASSKPEADSSRGFLTKSIRTGEKDIKYVVYVPSTYDPKTPTPTIIFLNGYGECGTDGLKQIGTGLGPAVMKDVKAWPFIIIFPQKQDHHHLWIEEDEMVMGILQTTQREYNIDKSRLYLTGLSQGGYGTWAIGAKHPELFAAIAPICGGGDESMAKKLVGMPIWAFHGEADKVVPASESKRLQSWLDAAGGSCQLTLYPGVEHNSWDKAYQEEKLGAWFLERQK